MNVWNVRFLSTFAACLFLAACGGPTYVTRIIETPETRGLKGHQKPYEVNGKRYEPLLSAPGFVEEGIASWYGSDFHGRPTSNGETYNMYAMTAAHKILPLGVFARITNLEDGRAATVRINDRGPFVKDRIIDLSYAAAKALGLVGPGIAPVRVEALGFQETIPSGETVYHQPASYNEGSFAIQVGAFTLQDNAVRLADRLRSRHGVSSIQEGWVNGRLFYRVRVGKYVTLDAAEAAKAGFEADGYLNSFVVATE